MQITTQDLGLTIRNHLEYTGVVETFKDAAGDIADIVEPVSSVDASDPNNLLVVMHNGQTFRVRILAEG